MGLWKLYWRSLGVYRGAKSVQAEWKAADKRQAARDAAYKAAKRAIAEGATPEEAEQIAEAAARDAVRRRSEIETHCDRRGTKATRGATCMALSSIGKATRSATLKATGLLIVQVKSGGWLMEPSSLTPKPWR